MNTFRSHIPLLLIVIGLMMPTMPVAGESCPRDSCRPDGQPAAQLCSDDGTELDSCCTADDRGQEEDAGRQDGSDDCCPHGCKCVCCDTADVPLVRLAPSSVKIAPRSIPVARHRLLFAPQDAVNSLLRPPQA